MDWDDVEPKKKTGIAVGDDLSNLSIEELQERIAALQDECTRIKAEIEAKQSTQSAANDVFKS